MKNQISVSELLAPTGIDEQQIRDQAESDGIELSEEQVREIAGTLLSDENLQAAKQIALNQALEKLLGSR